MDSGCPPGWPAAEMYFEVNGRQVFAGTGGKRFDNRKPVIIFLHGSGLDHSFWSLYTRYFAFRNYAVLALDLPGHTFSEGPQLTSIEAMCGWLHAVVQALNIDKLSLVGHSQGCLLALEFAYRFGAKLRSVSFITSGLATPINPALLDNAQNQPEAAIAMMLSWGFGVAGHLHQGPIPGNSMLAGGRKVMCGNAPNELVADLTACDTYKNGATAAAGVACACQVILAGQDRMAPRKAGLELVAGLSKAQGAPQLDIIEGCGHMLPLEAPNECRQLLKGFIFVQNPPERGPDSNAVCI